MEGGVTGGRVDVRRDAAEHARCGGSGLGSLPEPPCGVGAPSFGKDQCEKEEGGRRCGHGFGGPGFGGRYAGDFCTSPEASKSANACPWYGSQRR